MHLTLVGFNYKSTPLTLREALAFEREHQLDLARRLANHDAVSEALVFKTCNRTEVYAVGPCNEGVKEVVYQILSEKTGVDKAELQDKSYSYFEADAVRHLFRVVSSLDAMVVGEAQVLGQFKEAYQTAVEYDTAGPYLHKMCHLAFRTAKKVRTETDIAQLPVSVGTVAVELVEETFGDLGSATVLVIGAGEMGALVAARLKDRNVSHIWITNRTRETAEALAKKVSGVAVPFESWEAHLATADIVITSVGGGALMTRSHIETAMQERGGRSLVIMDLGVPRNVDVSADPIPSLKLYNIDDLQKVADKNLILRKRAAEKAEEMIKGESVTAFHELRHIKLAPLLKRLHEKCASVIKYELENVYSRHPDLSTEERSSIEACTQSIVKKILHEPIMTAKEELARPGLVGEDVSAATISGLFRV